MKRILPVIIAFGLSSSILFSTTPAMAGDSGTSVHGVQLAGQTDGSEPFSGSALCLPDAYPNLNSGCLPLGPAQILSDLARQGLVLPLRPLPASAPDPKLNQMPEQYLKVSSTGDVPLYPSLEAAENHETGSSLAGTSRGLRYLAVVQRVNNDKGIFYNLTSGDWINAGDADVSCCSSSGRFQGLLFQSNPTNQFGWIISVTDVKTSPGYNSPGTGEQLNQETVVQIYGMQEKDGTNWLLIGVDRWVDDNYVGRVTLNTTPPAGVTNNRWIEVNDGEQTLSVYDHGQLVFATLIATGVKPFYTRPGLFHIYKKKALETMRGAFEADKSDFYYLQDVPWTMYFDDARALHGAYWRTHYGYMASHGCVNLSPGDSNWLFNWAKEGDWVYVWDPSNKTPTDPKLYGSGGA
jgi:lipoprotein-anchoring transpeptidase ErfK/SrfK